MPNVAPFRSRIMHDSTRLEVRQVGGQGYALYLLPIYRIPFGNPARAAYGLVHLNAGGQELHVLEICHRTGVQAVAFELEAAWRLAAEHSFAFEVSGNCAGEIPVRARLGGKVHRGWLADEGTACGQKIEGGLLAARVPGNFKDYGDVACGRCCTFHWTGSASS